MKALLVARVSTEEQQEAGNSLPAQMERMKSYCKRREMDIVRECVFAESAYKSQRDEFDVVVEFVESTSEKIAVVFDKVDRLSRNIFDKRVARLYDRAVTDRIELHFVSDGQVINADMSAGDKFGFAIKLGLAKYYSDAISDNVKRAFEQKRRNGEWTGHPRLGYINVQTRNDAGEVVSRDIVPDPERAHLISMLFELYATGEHSITTLWERVTKEGLRSMDGKTLSRSNIELILKDTFYYGIAHSKKYGDYPHRYACLVSKELFDRCKAVREGRGKRPAKETGVPYIFKGILRCANCACLMTPETKKGKFIYYSCTNAKGICKRVYVPERTLLKPLWDLFKEFADTPEAVHKRLVSELRNSHESEVVYHERELSRVRAEYDRAQRRVNKLLDGWLDGSISQDVYDKKLQELKDQQYRLNIELEEHTKADHQYHIHVGTVLRLSKHMGVIFESSEPKEKRALLNYLLQNPTVEGKTLRYSLKKPYDAVLELARNPIGLRGQDSNLEPTP